VEGHPASQEGEAVIGSYAQPWEEITEQQQTARLDLVLDSETASEFCWNAQRDAYRRVDADPASPDFCPADAVEQRRKVLDRVRGER
jgi:hypothetical protein